MPKGHKENSALDFPAEFIREMEEQHLAFEIRGILTANDRVLTLGTDTKVLSTVFELLCQPLIQAIADRHQLKMETAIQTKYPDFTLMKGPADPAKIAVDIKTTYRRPLGFGFTLGSYTSFLRNDTKNITYRYSTYAKHWILGFVYSRAEAEESRVVKLEDRATITCPPYRDVEWFVQEKYKIAGLVPGSGNTANIQSIVTANVDDFRQGKGPFAAKGEEYFRAYWANFGADEGKKFYRTLAEFEAWKAKQPAKKH